MWSGLSTAQRVSQDVAAHAAGFSTALISLAGAGQLLTQPVAGQTHCCSNCSAQGGAPTPPPRHQRGILMAHRVVLCLASRMRFRWRAPHSVRSVAQCLPARLQQTSYRRLHRRAALEHGDATRSVSQARLESNHAVACQAFICSADLTSYLRITLDIAHRRTLPIVPLTAVLDRLGP